MTAQSVRMHAAAIALRRCPLMASGCKIYYHDVFVAIHRSGNYVLYCERVVLLHKGICPVHTYVPIQPIVNSFGVKHH